MVVPGDCTTEDTEGTEREGLGGEVFGERGVEYGVQGKASGAPSEILRSGALALPPGDGGLCHV